MATAGMDTFELDSSSSSSSDDSSQRLENFAEVVIVPRSWLGLEPSASARPIYFWLSVPGTWQLCKHAKYTDVTNKKGGYQ